MNREYILKIRVTPERTFASVWLMTREGAADACLLFGELVPAVARDLAERLGLPVEEEEWLLPNLQPLPQPGCATLTQQRDLFADPIED